MFDFFNDKKADEKLHILPKELRQGEAENAPLANFLGAVGVVCAIGGGIISIFNGLNMADKAVYNIRKGNK